MLVYYQTFGNGALFFNSYMKKLSKRNHGAFDHSFAIISVPEKYKKDFLDAITGALPATGTWFGQEPSYIIPDISFEDSKSLAEKYNQTAFIHKDDKVKLYNLKTNEATEASSISIGNIPNANTKSVIDFHCEFNGKKSAIPKA